MGKASLRSMRGFFTLDDLRLVHEIVEAGTLTGAASRLGVDHSTAFRRLGAVEMRLRAHLFERARDGYTPTPSGEAAAAAARRILDDLNDLERRLAGEDLRPSGIVRVTTTDTLVELMSTIFAELRAERPEITIELVVANSFFTLTKRDADIAVRPAVEVPEGLVARRLCGVASAPYASPAYLEQRGKVSLAEHDWLTPDESLAHLGSARWLRAHVPQERVVATANSLLVLRALARAGLGVAPLPCYLGDGDATLRRVAPLNAEMAASLWLITHPDLRRVARVRALLDFSGDHLLRRRSLLEGTAG